MKASRILSLATFLSALALAAPPVLAQAAQSTWDRIMSTKTLRVGFANGEPLAFKDASNSTAPGGVKFGEDTWRGVGPVLGKMIADALGVKIELVESSHAASIAGLQAGLIDMFLPIEATPERAKAADFIPVPLMWQGMTYFTRDPNAPTTWAALNDAKYRIGVVLGAASDTFAGNKVPKAQIGRFADPNDQVAAMQSGRVDGVIMFGGNATAAYGRLKSGKIIVPTPIVVTTNGVAVRREPDQSWHNYLTVALQYYYNNGTIDRIYGDFLAFRHIDRKDVFPIMKEQWPPEAFGYQK